MADVGKEWCDEYIGGDDFVLDRYVASVTCKFACSNNKFGESVLIDVVKGDLSAHQDT